MRVLVVGGDGQVARAVKHIAPPEHEVLVKKRSDLDIADREAVAAVLAAFPCDWVVNGAAYTAVDLAEDQAEEAYRVNATAVGVLAEQAHHSGARLLHISTDFVFDGAANRAYSPSDAANPLGVYGASKLAGERRALAITRSVVLRTAWVYAASGRNFLLTMLRLMRERPEVRVVSDQIGTPTSAGSIGQAVWAMINKAPAGGIYHWTDLGVASWYDFAVAIQDEALERGLLGGIIPILPIATREYPTRAVRPAFSVLDSASTRALTGLPGRHWRHQLRSVLDELRAA